MSRRRVAAAAIFGLVAWSAVAHPWGWAFGIGVHPYPESSSTPWTYQLYSGFLPALTVISLVTLVAGAWHHVNCAHDGCWRVGKHKVEGTPWCGRHQQDARQKAAATLNDVAERLDKLIALVSGERAP